jgi:ketosteroid isomerase-like protein
MELTAGTFRVELHEVGADDQHTVGLHLATGEREGRTLADREVLVFHVRDGKVAEAWQYVENQYAYDEFFSWTPRLKRSWRSWVQNGKPLS